MNVVYEREKNSNQHLFLFNSKTMDTFFGPSAGNCDYEATQSQNFTLGGAQTTHLDLSSTGNCVGACTITVPIGDIPNLQFIVAQCGPALAKVDVKFRVTSKDAVVCGDATYALTALPYIVAVCVLVVLDVCMLGVTFFLYRRKVQLEELKI